MFYNLFHSPTLFVKSSRDCAMSDSKPSCPLSQTVSFTVAGQKSRLAGVLALLQCSRPFAIGWPAVRNAFFAVTARIMTIVVFAFNAMVSGRLLAHVGQKLWKRMSPMCAYAYAASFSPTVPVVSGVVRVVTSSLHFTPRVVFWRTASATGTCAMAAARLDRLFLKIATSHGRLVATLTLTQPSRITAFSFASKFKNSKLVVFIASFVRSLLAAPTGRHIARPDGTTVENLFSSTFTTEQPVRSSLASKIGTGVPNRREIIEWLTSDVFYAGWADGRITRRHDSTPDKLDCDRAESVHNNCLGSFHFSLA